MKPVTKESLQETYKDFSAEELQGALQVAQDYLGYDTERNQEFSSPYWTNSIQRDELTIEVLTKLIDAKSTVAS